MKTLQARDGTAQDAPARFAVLGPVRVSYDGQATHIRGARPQALLTVLLLEANRVVTLERLGELIWECPPASATANLRTYACRLRGALGAAFGRRDPQRLTATASGYRLRVAPEESDLATFGERTRLGLEALHEDPGRAAVHLRSALSLWRGAAAENVPRTAGLAARLAAVEEQRHRATEHLMQARLALGEHELLVAELHELTAAHPARERFWCQLILAAYRCGDPGAAIAAFERARHVLRRELDIAPGSEMTDLYHRVLRRDPMLGAQTVRGSVSAATRPAQLHSYPQAQPRRLASEPPESPEPFAGRARESAYLLERLGSASGPHGLAAITGAAGTGKSALAAHVARELRGLGHDQCITLDLRGADANRAPLTPAQALRRLCALRQEANAPAAASFASFGGAAQPVVVLDNAANASQVQPLISALASCPVIVTSRSVVALPGPVIRLDLAPLCDADSRRLLTALCGTDRAVAEPDRIEELAGICCGLPLALHIAGGRLAARAEWSVGAFVEILADERCRLDELADGDLAVRSSFAVSYRALTQGAGAAGERAARLFHRLGRARDVAVDADRAAELLGCDRVLATAALGRLADARLLEPAAAFAGAGGYRMTELMRIFAAEQHEPDEPQEPGEHRERSGSRGGRGIARPAGGAHLPGYRPPNCLRTTPSTRSAGR